jgi:hypothetical protein
MFACRSAMETICDSCSEKKSNTFALTYCWNCEEKLICTECAEWRLRGKAYSRQTFLIYKSDNDTDLQCDTSLESLEHLFVKCDEVQGSHILQIDILHNCLVNGMSANIVIHDFTQLILFNGQKRKRKKKKRIFLLIFIG